MNKNFSINLNDYFDSESVLLLDKIAYECNDFGYKIYLVGGIVRDILLCRKNIDIDLLIEGDALKFAFFLKDKFNNIEILKIQEDLHTATICFDQKIIIDFASTRSEIYPKNGFLPQINEIGVSLEKDAMRRDFTINTLLISLNRENKYALIDIQNGVSDLENGFLRILHKKSFIEDPTRILRCLKFCVRFNFVPEKDTLRLMNEYIEKPDLNIPMARMKSEFEQTFNLNEPRCAEIFSKQGLYKILAQEINKYSSYERLEALIKRYIGPSKYIWLIYFIVFFHNKKMPEFNFDNTEKQIIDGANKLFETKDEKKLYFILDDIKIESIVSYSFISGDENIFEKINRIRDIKIFINGDMLIKLGYKPSAIFKKIFESILEEKLKGNLLTEKEEILFVKNKFKID